MTILAFVPDLMDKSKFGSVAGDKVFVRAVTELAKAENGDTVVADLGRPGALEALAAVENVRKVGFSSHVDAETIATAKALGVDAYPRSRFFSHIVEILAQENH